MLAIFLGSTFAHWIGKPTWMCISGTGSGSEKPYNLEYSIYNYVLLFSGVFLDPLSKWDSPPSRDLNEPMSITIVDCL